MDPEEIENREFDVSMRGYARHEVEAFREEVAQEIKILRKQLTKATSDLSHANSELKRTRAQLADTNAQLTEERSGKAPEHEGKQEIPPPEDRAAVFKMVGQETERILLAAEQAAEQIHDRAVKESAEMITDARLQVQRSMEELEAARRAAEEDFRAISDTRSMVASQLEDIRRRLEETIGRLRVPVELPGSKPMRSRGPQGGSERSMSQAPLNLVKEAEIHAQQRQQREVEAAKVLAARQTAHLAQAERRESELKVVQAEAEQRAQAHAEREAREREAREAALARKAQEARAAAAAADAERLKSAREAEGLREAQEAERAARLAAERAAMAEAEQAAKAERVAKAEAEQAAKAEAERAAKAEAEQAAKAEAERAAKAEAEQAAKAERVAKAEAEQAAKAEAERAAKAEAEKTPPPPKAVEERPKSTGDDASSRKAASVDHGSSLDELLEEIRRKREEERKRPAVDQQTATDDVAQEIFRRNEVLGDLPAQTARRLKRLLQEDHNDLLDRLRTQRGKGPLGDNLAPVSEQLGRFVAGLNEALGRAFAEGHKAGGAVGSVDASRAVTRLVSRQVLNPLRAEVSKAVETGLEAEDSPSALSERANDVFRVWKGVRTQLLGEGISYAAYNQGLLEALGSRPGARKVWVLATDEHECPNDICKRNASAGEVELKSSFPSGHLAPPAHGGCTCTLKGS